SILTIIIASYSAYHGIETIARVNNLLLPIGLLALSFVIFLNIPEMDFKFFLPVLNQGVAPPLRGALLIQSWLLKSIILLQLIPFVEDKENIRRDISIGTIVLSGGLMGGVLLIAVFGPLAQKIIFPALSYVRIIEFGRYIENIDALIMVIWIIGIFINISISFYAVVLGLAQLFSLKSYKPLITPIAIIIVCFSILIAPRMIQLTNFIHYIYPFYVCSVAITIPIILLLVSKTREKS
ncbi:GerAB/ArcD/ProY family transporter, partial [Halonatronum saccharophilum]